MNPGGALPYVGGYQVPVNRPPFLRRSYTQWPPFFYSVHTQWPPFFHFCIKFYIKIANFCALRAHFEKFNDFCGNFNRKFASFALKLHFCTLNEPHFWESTSEKPPFFGAHWHRMTPFFRRNFTPNAPYFRSPVGTCTSLSYLSAPRAMNTFWMDLSIYSFSVRYSYSSELGVPFQGYHL